MVGGDTTRRCRCWLLVVPVGAVESTRGGGGGVERRGRPPRPSQLDCPAGPVVALGGLCSSRVNNKKTRRLDPTRDAETVNSDRATTTRPARRSIDARIIQGGQTHSSPSNGSTSSPAAVICSHLSQSKQGKRRGSSRASISPVSSFLANPKSTDCSACESPCSKTFTP